MVQQILQALVFTLMAIPFIYMAFDVSRELSVQTVRFVNKKVRPGVTSLINLLIK